jgi:hypothetical protein
LPNASPADPVSAASDDAPAKPGNGRQGTRHMSLVGSRIGDVDIAEDVGGHGTPPGQKKQWSTGL